MKNQVSLHHHQKKKENRKLRDYFDKLVLKKSNASHQKLGFNSFFGVLYNYGEGKLLHHSFLD